MIIQWFGGEQLSDRADEDERRAHALLDVLDKKPELIGLASNAVMKLPEDHPLHDDARLAGMERHLAESKAAGDLEESVSTIGDLLTTMRRSTQRGGELVAEALELGKNEGLEVGLRQTRNARGVEVALPSRRRAGRAPGHQRSAQRGRAEALSCHHA